MQIAERANHNHMTVTDFRIAEDAIKNLGQECERLAQMVKHQAKQVEALSTVSDIATAMMNHVERYENSREARQICGRLREALDKWQQLA